MRPWTVRFHEKTVIELEEVNEVGVMQTTSLSVNEQGWISGPC